MNSPHVVMHIGMTCCGGNRVFSRVRGMMELDLSVSLIQPRRDRTDTEYPMVKMAFSCTNWLPKKRRSSFIPLT